MNTKLVLLDGAALFYAAYYAMPPLTAPNGAPTGATKGFDAMLKQLRTRFAEARMIAVFDAKGKTFRHQMAPSYKANRKPMPTELVSQIAAIQTLPKLLGLPVIVQEGVEADDVIGSLATQANAQELATVIVTPDKDMNQLITRHVSVYNMRKDSWMTAMSVEKQYGVSVSQFIDYLTLIGDTSDNIPGVDKVGPKTASKLLKKYGTLDALLAAADTIAGVLGENLRHSRTTIPLNKQLITIKCDLAMKLDDFQHTPVQENELAALYHSLGFTNLSAGNSSPPRPTAQQQADIEYIHTAAELDRVAAHIAEQKQPTALYPLCAEESGELLGVALAFANRLVYVVARNTALRMGLASLLNQLSSGVYLDAKQMFRLLGVVAEQDNITDISLMSYLLNPTAGRTLVQLAHTYLNTLIPSAAYPPNASKKERLAAEQDDVTLALFATQCAEVIHTLADTLEVQLAQKTPLHSVLHTIELPLLSILLKMEHVGALLDCDLLRTYSKRIEGELATLEQRVFAYADASFNINSTKQVQEFLFKHLGLKPPKKTKAGGASTSESTLQTLDHPAAEYILQYRKWQKLKTGYTDPLPTKVDAHNRVHTTFNQTVVSTGRLSSSHPNLQNIPIKTEDGKMIRAAFIAKEGYSLVSADYSQIELRVMAHLSEDARMVADFQSGADIHASTAAEVFDVPLAQVNETQRRRAKAINFGLIYGTTPFGLAKQLDVNPPTAQQFIDAYFDRYQGVHTYMETSKHKAKEQGFVQTVAGRQLAIPTIHDANAFVRAAAERLAINAPIQGSAADIIKLAMIAVDRWLGATQHDATMLLQVHDELVFEVRDDSVDEFIQMLPSVMSEVLTLSVPLVVDVGTGKNWSEAH